MGLLEKVQTLNSVMEKVSSLLPVCNFINAYMQAVIDLQRNLSEMQV